MSIILFSMGGLQSEELENWRLSSPSKKVLNPIPSWACVGFACSSCVCLGSGLLPQSKDSKISRRCVIVSLNVCLLFMSAL